MRNLMIAAFAAALAIAAPTGSWAQPHQQSGHPSSAPHPAMSAAPRASSPVSRAPQPAEHRMSSASHPSVSHHPVSGHVARHTTAAHHVSTHRTTARHVTTHRTTARHVTTHRTTARHVTTHRTVTRHVTRTTRVTTRATRPSRAQIAALHKNITAVHRFHAGVYRAPPGFHYQRWGFGAFLPAVYFAPQFWISDWLAFDLFAPPYGYVWVRYGPDALLIDEYTGEIVQADYAVFY